MIIDEGNLWTYLAEAIVVTTNGILDRNGHLVMGAGVAKQAKLKFQQLPEMLGRAVKETGNIPYYIPQFGIMSFPTKHHWKNKSDIRLIEASAKQAVLLADEYKLFRIIMPPPGCGNGGLIWEDVFQVISPILDDRFICLVS